MKADVLQSAKHALESLDTNRLVSLYADDFVFEDTASNEVIISKEELRKYYHHLFALPNVKFSNVSFFHCEDRGAGEWTWSGTKSGSDAEYSIKGASIFELRDGKIRRETIYYAPRSALP